MKHIYKYIILYLLLLSAVFASVFLINGYAQEAIKIQKSLLLKQAQIHFETQVQARAWNSNFGGIYVKPTQGIQANPYLQNPTLKVDDNLTLIKINPAWMTRQLSQLSQKSKNHGFSFRITSLHPLNPKNIASDFETRALRVFAEKNEQEYYEINANKFNYMGALITKKSCLSCHQAQGYTLGDIKGGISIELNASEYIIVQDKIEKQARLLNYIAVLIFSILAFLVHTQLKNQERLAQEVLKQTHELISTKVLLQQVLDADKSFLMVSHQQEIILANKTMLDFFSCTTLEEFLHKYQHIANFFEVQENEELLSKYIDGEHWLEYLYREQEHKDIKILMLKDAKRRYFKPHLKKLMADNKKLFIIIFDEVTQELQKIKNLQNEAAKDTLTNLFNRRKFNTRLPEEINLAITAQKPLSIIFLDIDHFKHINDTYGHDVGDYILVEISKILSKNVRTSDFVARWGGEEFVIILQSTSVEKAFNIAEEIRITIEQHVFQKGGSQKVSLGVTQYIESESADSLLKRVDTALYEAKDNGRNRVVMK